MACRRSICVISPTRRAYVLSRSEGASFARGLGIRVGLKRPSPMSSSLRRRNRCYHEWKLTTADPLYLFCTCTAAFRRFLPIEPFVFSKTFENLHTAADRLPPPPPTCSNSFDNLRVFSCRSRRLQYFSICAPERGPTVPPSGGGFARFSRQFRDRVIDGESARAEVFGQVPAALRFHNCVQKAETDRPPREASAAVPFHRPRSSVVGRGRGQRSTL